MMKLRPDDYRRLRERGRGVCAECHALAWGVEYECEECRARDIRPIEDALALGWIRLDPAAGRVGGHHE
jgi:hypothetical protein